MQLRLPYTTKRSTCKSRGSFLSSVPWLTLWTGSTTSTGISTVSRKPSTTLLSRSSISSDRALFTRLTAGSRSPRVSYFSLSTWGSSWSTWTSRSSCTGNTTLAFHGRSRSSCVTLRSLRARRSNCTLISNGADCSGLARWTRLTCNFLPQYIQRQVAIFRMKRHILDYFHYTHESIIFTRLIKKLSNPHTKPTNLS